MQSEVLLSLLFPPLLHVVMNALLSEGTWHCKMAILIYLYFIALSFLSNIGTITSQNFPAIPSQKHHSESSHLSFSCLRFHVIFSVKQLKHSKIWNCHLGYCNTKYVDDHSYPINSFCYLQLKSTNPINTIFFFLHVYPLILPLILPSYHGLTFFALLSYTSVHLHSTGNITKLVYL